MVSTNLMFFIKLWGARTSTISGSRLVLLQALVRYQTFFIVYFHSWRILNHHPSNVIFLNIAMLGIKTYLEMYEGKIKKKKVEYQSYKTATHSVLFLWVFASFAFHYSLWGEYGIKTILIMTGMVGYGCLLQFMMLVPTWFQNIVLFIGLTFFLQQYQWG